MRTALFAALAALLILGLAADTRAHCQVPCGIYDDAARIQSLREDAATIAKATKNIAKLAAAHDGASINQLIRWTNTKEEHASNIIQVVSEYFLTQKLKPVPAGSEGHDDYVKALQDHHAVLRAAMKTKQKVDAGVVKALEDASTAMAAHW